MNLPDTLLAEDRNEARHHRQAAELVLRSGQARIVAPHTGSVGDESAVNPSEFLLVFCPWKFDDESAGVVEVLHRPGASPKAQRGYLRFLTVICEIVADFHRHRQVREFRNGIVQWRRFEQFSERVHSSFDLEATAYQIANEGRRFVDCDRVSVLITRGSNCRLVAVSGVDTFNPRSNVIRHLERLAAAVIVGHGSLWHPQDPERLPPETSELLHAYLDDTHSRTLIIVPLQVDDAEQDLGPQHARGVLAVEQFHGELDDGLRARVDMTCRHSALAMRNALELKSIPFVRPLRWLGKARWCLRMRNLPKTLLALLAFIAVVIALAVVQTDFEVEARGKLQPEDLRDVFAPSEGVVIDLRAVHAETVRAGEILAVLRTPELDLEFQRVWGELQTAQKRLTAVEAERLRNPREIDNQQRRRNQLTAEEEELKELVRSLQRQYEMVQEQQAQLEVRSPVDGQVLTWDLTRLLEARPVQRGQVLMSVGTLDGPWVLELEIPDDRIAYVLWAQQESGSELDVNFILATNPGIAYEGSIKNIAGRAEITESGDCAVLATVSINRDEIPELMPGATVVARIYCGRRSIGYVWLHDLFEAVWSWIAF